SLQASLLGRVRPHLGSAERVRAGMKATCTENHLSRRSTTIGCESGARADKIVGPARLSRAVRLRLIDRGACPMNPPFAIDIYQGDNVQDTPGPLGGFARVKAMGIAFLLHKATEGVDVIDKRYDARRAAWMDDKPVTVKDVDGTILQLKPRFAAYHFFHGS